MHNLQGTEHVYRQLNRIGCMATSNDLLPSNLPSQPPVCRLHKQPYIATSGRPPIAAYSPISHRGRATKHRSVIVPRSLACMIGRDAHKSEHSLQELKGGLHGHFDE